MNSVNVERGRVVRRGILAIARLCLERGGETEGEKKS